MSSSMRRDIHNHQGPSAVDQCEDEVMMEEDMNHPYEEHSDGEQLFTCYQCPICKYQAKTEKLVHLHVRDLHGTRVDMDRNTVKEGPGRLNCPVGCEPPCASYDLLVRHIETAHDFRREDIETTFSSREQFEDWMVQLFFSTGAFVRKRGERQSVDGNSVGVYHCVFDGKKRITKSTRAENKAPYVRRLSTRKLGCACPAHIRYSVDRNGIVRIRGQLRHFGHEIKPIDHSNPCRTLRRKTNEVAPRRNREMHYTIDDEEYDDHHPVSPVRLLDDGEVGLYEEEVRGLEVDEDVMHRKNERSEYEMDEEGMVSLFTVTSLQSARVHANSALASAEITLAECYSVTAPVLNKQLPSLISKYQQLAAIASKIESQLKIMKGVKKRRIVRKVDERVYRRIDLDNEHIEEHSEDIREPVMGNIQKVPKDEVIQLASAIPQLPVQERLTPENKRMPSSSTDPSSSTSLSSPSGPVKPPIVQTRYLLPVRTIPFPRGRKKPNREESNCPSTSDESKGENAPTGQEECDVVENATNEVTSTHRMRTRGVARKEEKGGTEDETVNVVDDGES